MQSIIRIPFEIIISDDIRFVGPSGGYVNITSEPENSLERLLQSEMDKAIKALQTTINKPRATASSKINNYKKEL